MAETKFGDMIRTSMENIKSMLDANTVIGEPIKTDSGTTLIPVSKITVGYASGGIDYVSNKKQQEKRDNNFGGGGGTGMTVVPVAFIAVDKDGKASVLSVNSPVTHEDNVSRVLSLVENSPEIVTKIKDAFSKGNKDQVD